MFFYQQSAYNQYYYSDKHDTRQVQSRFTFGRRFSPRCRVDRNRGRTVCLGYGRLFRLGGNLAAAHNSLAPYGDTPVGDGVMHNDFRTLQHQRLMQRGCQCQSFRHAACGRNTLDTACRCRLRHFVQGIAAGKQPHTILSLQFSSSLYFFKSPPPNSLRASKQGHSFFAKSRWP